MKLFVRMQREIVFLLLFCYPKDYRTCFGPEIYKISTRLVEEAAAEGWASLFRVSLRELGGLLKGLLRARCVVSLQPLQRAILGAIAAYLLLLSLIALALYDASNANYSSISGLMIGNYQRDGGTVYVSGKRLTCQPSDKADYTDRCSIVVTGQTLVVYGKLYLLTNTATCEAWYMQQQRPCEMTRRTVAFSQHAYLEDGLGLNAEQLEVLRRAHPIENLEENTLFPAVVCIIPLFTALLFSGLVGGFFWVPRRKVTIPVLLLITVFAFAVWIGTTVSFMILSRDFWD